MYREYTQLLIVLPQAPSSLTALKMLAFFCASDIYKHSKNIDLIFIQVTFCYHKNVPSWHMPTIKTSALLRCVPFAKAHPALTSVMFVACIVSTVEQGGLPLFETEQ